MVNEYVVQRHPRFHKFFIPKLLIKNNLLRINQLIWHQQCYSFLRKATMTKVFMLQYYKTKIQYNFRILTNEANYKENINGHNY